MYRELVVKALPLLWPEGWALRARMVLCFLVLILSRVCNMLVPLCYKGAIDTLSEVPPPPPAADTTPVRDAWTWLNVLAANPSEGGTRFGPVSLLPATPLYSPLLLAVCVVCK